MANASGVEPNVVPDDPEDQHQEQDKGQFNCALFYFDLNIAQKYVLLKQTFPTYLFFNEQINFQWHKLTLEEKMQRMIMMMKVSSIISQL